MFDEIVLPLDQSALAECVFPHAVAIAQAYGSKIVLLHVKEPVDASSIAPCPDPFDWQAGIFRANQYLDKTANRLREARLGVETCIEEGRPADRIVAFAGAHPDALILLSSHGRSGLKGWTISSVVQKVALRSRASVMIVPAYQPSVDEIAGLHYRRILVPVDGSARSNYVLPFAKAIAQSQNAELLLVHVLPCPEIFCPGLTRPSDLAMVHRILEHNREEVQGHLDNILSWMTGDVRARFCLITGEGSVPACLHEAADQYQADLVILNAHGYSGSPKNPYGSVALHFLFYGNHPLLMIQDFPGDQIGFNRAESVSGEIEGNYRMLQFLAS